MGFYVLLTISFALQHERSTMFHETMLPAQHENRSIVSEQVHQKDAKHERGTTFHETYETVQPAQYEQGRLILSEQVRPSEYMTSEHIRSPQVRLLRGDAAS